MKARAGWVEAGMLWLVLAGAAAGTGAAPAAAAAAGSSPVITTVVGGAGRGLARNVAQTPLAVTAAPDGGVYVVDNSGAVRALNGTSTWEKAIAGGGDKQPGDSGPAALAELSFLKGVAVDASGNLVVGDTGDSRVRVVAAGSGTFYRQVMTAGHIYTLAGTGTRGFSGDGGPATSAMLAFPGGVTVDAAGNLVIADTASSRVRVVAAASGTFYRRAMTAGDIYTVAGDGTRGYSGDGSPAAAAKIREPDDVAVDRSGNLVIADTGSRVVRVVAAASGRFYGQAMTEGDIYTVAGNDLLLSGNRGKALNAELALPADIEDAFPGTSTLAPSGMAASSSGDYAIYDNAEVRLVAVVSGTHFGHAMTAGNVYDVAGTGRPRSSGDGGQGTSAGLQAAGGVAFDPSGNLIIADTGSRVVRVVAAASGRFYGQVMAAGHIYSVAGTGGDGYSGNTGPAASAELSTPSAVAVDHSGNLVIADTDTQSQADRGRIRVVAASTGIFYGQAMTAGHIYTVAGSGARHAPFGNGVPAISAGLTYPGAVAVDAAGNLVIDQLFDGAIRVVAAISGTFYGRHMLAGDIYTVAGVENSQSVAADQSGNLIVADGGFNLVQVVAGTSGTFYGQQMVAGDTYTIAGNGNFGYSGDGGPAISATLDNPEAVTVDAQGRVLIADDGNRRVRAISP